MARFRFRFEASRRVAEQVLEMAQRRFAQEMQSRQACRKACDIQQKFFYEALEGQRAAGRYRPEELGIWQVFVSEQRLRLHKRERELAEQEKILEEARHTLLNAYREAEKFRRLKEKLVKAFLAKEALKEQKVLDETGQVLYRRRQSQAIPC